MLETRWLMAIPLSIATLALVVKGEGSLAWARG